MRAWNRRKPEPARVQVLGDLSACPWSLHLWLNRCPLPAQFNLVDSGQPADLLLHLQPVELTIAQRALRQLRRCPLVLDPLASQAAALQRHGVRAVWLDPHGPANGWLERSFCADQAATSLGLPNPLSLRQHGEVLCLGSGGDAWEHGLRTPIWNLPVFEGIAMADPASARLMAGWLERCQQLGLQLVRLQPSAMEQHSGVWQTLADQGHAPLLLEGPVTPEQLEQLLPRRLCPTPRPRWEVLQEHGSAAAPARAAVCVSLFNYQERIIGALSSAASQSERQLELIIVDDNSSDGSVEVVQRWLQQHAQRFSRTLLVRHHHNAGLAASRNTAFELAQASWCFVLDADNALEPDAVKFCLAVAESSPATTAVVHPLVELRSESQLPGQPQQALLSQIPWQREAFRRGNQIDAMALVRRRHWQQVGGFSHIPGGWEDYDFWCKLIEAGLGGVICPQRLAIYNRHDQSMQATTTLAFHDQLQQLLQSRHPWLALNQ